MLQTLDSQAIFSQQGSEDLWTIHCSLGLGSSDMQAATPLPCPGAGSRTLRLLLHALRVVPCSAFRAKEALGNPSLDQ